MGLPIKCIYLICHITNICTGSMLNFFFDFSYLHISGLHPDHKVEPTYRSILRQGKILLKKICFSVK